MSDDDAQSRPSGFDALWQTVLTDDSNLQAPCARRGDRLRPAVQLRGGERDADRAGRPITVGSTMRPRWRSMTPSTPPARDRAWPLRARGGWCASTTPRTTNAGPSSPPALGQRCRQSLSVPLVLSVTTRSAGSTCTAKWSAGSARTTNSGEAFAAQASIVVSNAQAYWAAFELSNNLAKAMETRSVIEQAKGVLMAANRIDADEAFELLRQRSQTSNRKLHDVATDVVRRHDRDGDA